MIAMARVTAILKQQRRMMEIPRAMLMRKLKLTEMRMAMLR